MNVTGDEHLTATVDTVWLLLTIFGIFIMQAGFLLLEAGAVSANQTRTIMLKNICDGAIGAMAWFLLGNYLYSGNLPFENDTENFVGIFGVIKTYPLVLSLRIKKHSATSTLINSIWAYFNTWSSALLGFIFPFFTIGASIGPICCSWMSRWMSWAVGLYQENWLVLHAFLFFFVIGKVVAMQLSADDERHAWTRQYIFPIK